MSIETCIGRLVAQKKITQEQADDARALYDGMLNGDLFRNMDKATAEAYATLKTADALEEAAKARKLALARNVAAYHTALQRLEAHPDGPFAGLNGLMSRDLRNKGPGINVEAMQQDYAGRLAKYVHDLQANFGSKLGGLKQDVNGIRNVIRGMFYKTGDKFADDMAESLTKGMDWGADKAKQLGKVFEPNEDYRVPQWWESGRVKKLGRNTFVDDVRKEVQGNGLQVFDPKTGKMALGDRREQVISDAAEHIMTDLNKQASSASVFRDEMRVFRFTGDKAGAESYLRMMDKYGPGQGGYLGMVQGHFEKIGKELGLLHVLGPGWYGTSERLLQDATEMQAKFARPNVSLLNPWQKLGDWMLTPLEGRIASKRLMEYTTGRLSGTESELISGIMTGARSFMTAGSMGSAIITALPSDTVNWLMAASRNGLDSGRLVQRVVDTFLTDSEDKAAFAARLGIVAHATSRFAIGTKQYGDQIFGQQVMERMADFVIRSQGLHAWDSAIKRSWTMEFLASIGERTGKSFDQLDAPFQKFFTGYGMTSNDWATLTKAQVLQAGDAKFLTPDSLEEGLRSKIMSAIYDERQFAYLAGGSAHVRALATGGFKGGTVPGEIAKSFFLFKTFSVSMLSTWGVRAAQDAASGNLSTAVQLGLFVTFAGALALQAKQILQGKNPRSMLDGNFWKEAAFQGGALGIYGDFLRSAMSRSDTSLYEAILGPLASIPGAVGRLTSDVQRMEEGEHVNFGSALADDLERFTPGSSIWYARLAANRYIFDTIKQRLDPDYARAFQRQKEQAMKRYGQDFWFAPGTTQPQSAPNLGAAVTPQRVVH